MRNKYLEVKGLLFFITLLCFTNLYSQNTYELYYEKINKAELAIIDKEYEDAHKLYVEAFTHHFPFLWDINNFIALTKSKFHDFTKSSFYKDLIYLNDIFYPISMETITLDLFKRVETDISIKNSLIARFDYITEEDFAIPSREMLDYSIQLEKLLAIDKNTQNEISSDSLCIDVIKKTDLYIKD